MNLIPTFTPLIKRKLATAVLITASIAAFATLGDGGKKRSNSIVVYNYSKTFSLRSGFNYKSNNLFALPEPKNFIMLNTVVTYQKGSATYIIPLKKKVLLDKVRITPSPFRF
ncbi:MAG: hypothetical protein ACM3VS_05165 [Candidatus Dadabacteria bacterium]